MDRLLVVRCPGLLEEDEGGATLRTFVSVLAAVEVYCPWVEAVRPGICSLPARGPARYFGGEQALVDLVAGATAAITDTEVGIADGLFGAVLAARAALVVPAGTTPAFLAPLPVSALGDPDLAELLARLGIRTLGEFAALPERHVLGRFGADGVACHRVARGDSGELAGLRQPGIDRHIESHQHGGRPAASTQGGFWGGASDRDARAARTLADVQRILGADGVLRIRLQGGRSPAERSRLVTWGARETPSDRTLDAPWPGQIPPPAPAIVHTPPLGAEVIDDAGEPVVVSGRGLLTATPGRLSVAGGPWTAVTAWAGPWPAEERWWSRARRRTARMQVVLAGEDARLLLTEQGRWWVEATYG
jgi:nucleotidyltransferase/DNA polymerase involved in DNA repair